MLTMAINGENPLKVRSKQPLQNMVKTVFHHDQLADLCALIEKRLKDSANATRDAEAKLTGIERAYFRGALDAVRLLWEQQHRN